MGLRGEQTGQGHEQTESIGQAEANMLASRFTAKAKVPGTLPVTHLKL